MTILAALLGLAMIEHEPLFPLLARLWSSADALMASYTTPGFAISGATSDWERDSDARWPDNYEGDFAEHMFTYTTAAYCNAAALGRLQCGTICEEMAAYVGDASYITVVTAPHTETQTLVSSDHINDLVVVATRGTTPWDLSFWIINIGALPQRIPDYCSACFVHSAFYAAYGAVKRDVYAIMSEAVIKSPALVPAVLGHSAGGATAYLTTMDIVNKIGIPKRLSETTLRYVITYGAPRVGNGAFVAELQSYMKHGNTEGWRVIRGGDPIPYAVPALMGYVHALPEVWHLDDGRYKICKSADTSAWLVKEDPTCSQSTFNVDVGDHTDIFGVEIFTKIMSCGLANADNSYFNNTLGFVFVDGAQRMARSFMPF